MSGIFSENVFGLRGFGSTGLGSVTVPWWCWNAPNFKDHNAKCSQYSGAEHDACLQTAIDNICPWSDPPTSDEDKKLLSMLDSAAGKSCSSKEAVMFVQKMTGNPNIDGSWGPESQKYLANSKGKFKDFVECTGPAPGTGGSTSTSTVTTPAAVDPAKIAGGDKQAGFSDMFNKVPTIAWVGVAGIAGLLLLRAAKKGRS